MTNPRFYIPEALPGELSTWFKPIPEDLNYKKDLPPNYFDTVERVEDISQAEVVVLPNNFKTLTPAAEAYIAHWAAEGERLHIPVYVFSLGDFTDGTRFDSRVHVFRYSVYRSSMQPNDIVMPTLTEDNAKDGIVVRPKHAKPKVSFCGMGDLATWRTWAAYHVKNARFEMLAWIQGPLARARKLGVYWRRKSMAACQRSTMVETHFIVRKTFSGSSRTIELDPKQARKEYLDSIINADFVLAPKGDGNYSNRFLKTLCMGRIPVLTDTDAVLPFEDRIDYSQIVVKVPMAEVSKTPEHVRAFYDALSEKDWEQRQQLARTTFDRYLRQDAFFKEFFMLQ